MTKKTIKMSDDYFQAVCDAIGYSPQGITRLVVELEVGDPIVVHESRHLTDEED